MTMPLRPISTYFKGFSAFLSLLKVGQMYLLTAFLLCLITQTVVAQRVQDGANTVSPAPVDSILVEDTVKSLGSLRISRINSSTYHGSAALGEITGFDIWLPSGQERVIGYGLNLVRPKVIYNLGFLQSKLDFADLPRRFGIPPNLPDLSRTESITFINLNLGADYIIPRSPLERLTLAVGPTIKGARYVYDNEALNYFSLGLGGQATYRFGLFYFGMEYRAMLINPEYFKNTFRWEVGLWFDL
jgi:hypothetical protein